MTHEHDQPTGELPEAELHEGEVLIQAPPGAILVSRRNLWVAFVFLIVAAVATATLAVVAVNQGKTQRKQGRSLADTTAIVCRGHLVRPAGAPLDTATAVRLAHLCGPHATGATGQTGQTGQTGAVGGGGKRGRAGHNGTNGHNGVNGHNGARGTTGATGVGVRGRQGPTGPRGRQGPAGPPGPRGRPGPAGVSTAPAVQTLQHEVDALRQQIAALQGQLCRLLHTCG